MTIATLQLTNIMVMTDQQVQQLLQGIQNICLHASPTSRNKDAAIPFLVQRVRRTNSPNNVLAPFDANQTRNVTHYVQTIDTGYPPTTGSTVGFTTVP